MPFYEHVFIARQDLAPQQVEGLAADFSKLIADNGGLVTKTEQWGLKSLAYPIAKNRKGHYVLFNIDAPAPAVAELERQARIHEDVIRYLSVRVDELDEKPSAQMRRDRDDRGDRGDRGDRPNRDDRPREDRPRRRDAEDASQEIAQ